MWSRQDFAQHRKLNTLRAPETKFETSGKPPSLANADPTRPKVTIAKNNNKVD